MSTPPLDDFGRPVIAGAIQDKIDTAFAAVPKHRRGAVLVIADEHGTRGHFAAKFGDHWRVAAGAGIEWEGKRPHGYVGVEFSIAPFVSAPRIKRAK